MNENEAQDDKMDTAIQDVENKKDAQLKKKKEEEKRNLKSIQSYVCRD